MRLTVMMAGILLLSGCTLSPWDLGNIRSWSDTRLCEYHAYFGKQIALRSFAGEEISRRQQSGVMSLDDAQCVQAGQSQLDAQAAYNEAYWISQGLDRTRF